MRVLGQDNGKRKHTALLTNERMQLMTQYAAGLGSTTYLVKAVPSYKKKQKFALGTNNTKRENAVLPTNPSG